MPLALPVSSVSPHGPPARGALASSLPQIKDPEGREAEEPKSLCQKVAGPGIERKWVSHSFLLPSGHHAAVGECIHWKGHCGAQSM